MPKSILRDSIYSSLLSDILSGKFPPGSGLREEHIAAQLAVSRTPVREALRKLAEEGFVEYLPHRGARLIRPTAQDARDIFQIREALEAVAAAEAALRMSEDRLCFLRNHFEALRPRVSDGDYADVGDILHDEIFAACGNNRLQQLMQNFHSQIRMLQAVTIRVPGRLAHAFAEHDRVLTALEARHPSAAEAAIRTHLHNTLSDLQQCLESHEQTPSNGS